MPLDTVLAQGVQLPQFKIPDYASEMAQMAQLQSAQNQNALAQYQLASAKRGDEQQNALADFVKNADFTDPKKRAELFRFGKFGLEIAKSLEERDAAGLNRTKTQGEIDAQVRKANQDRLDTFSQEITPLAVAVQQGQPLTHNDVFRVHNTLVQRGVLKPEDSQSIPMKVEDLPAWVTNLAVKTKESRDALLALTPTYVRQDIGNSVVSIQNNPLATGYGRPTNSIPAIVKTPTIAETENARHAGVMEKIAKGNLDVSQQRLKIAEKEANSPSGLSPESTDILAQVYLQTGNLPPLGSGQNAANSRQAIFNRAAQLSANPSDAAATASGITANKQNTVAAQAVVKDFTSGISSRKVTANNTAINHLETMEKLADDLNNRNTNIVNKAGNLYAEQTGSAAPTNFDAAKQLVAAEVIKAVVNNGGGVKEREEAAQNFNNARSPAQLKGVIKTYKELLGGQLQSLGKQYEVGSGRQDFQEKFLFSNTRKILPSQATNQPNKAVIDDLLKKY
jgi:hypothetical protein